MTDEYLNEIREQLEALGYVNVDVQIGTSNDRVVCQAMDPESGLSHALHCDARRHTSPPPLVPPNKIARELSLAFSDFFKWKAAKLKFESLSGKIKCGLVEKGWDVEEVRGIPSLGKPGSYDIVVRIYQSEPKPQWFGVSIPTDSATVDKFDAALKERVAA